MNLNKVYAAVNTLKEFCESYSPGCEECPFIGEYGCELCKIPERFKKYEVGSMKIKIKYHNGMEEWPLEKFDKGDWIDVRAAEDVTLVKFQPAMISLGISMQLPKGYHAQLAPRSSTFKNFGIIMANSIGIIDNSYCGDNDIWHFPAIAMKNGVVHKGDRIAQFRIVKNSEPITFETVETLGNTDRGGIGSTG